MQPLGEVMVRSVIISSLSIFAGTCKLSVTGLDVDEDVPYSFIKVRSFALAMSEWPHGSIPGFHSRETGNETSIGSAVTNDT